MCLSVLGGLGTATKNQVVRVLAVSQSKPEHLVGLENTAEVIEPKTRVLTVSDVTGSTNSTRVKKTVTLKTRLHTSIVVTKNPVLITMAVIIALMVISKAI